jgi:ubiquinone/menaquinone biosynthesis C-methylase UbiE
MSGRFDPRRLAALDNPLRRLIGRPKGTLRSLGLRRGDAFVDFGAGSGFFSLPAAEIVGSEGRVLALDIAPEAVGLIERKSRERGIRNLRAILSTEDSLGLPEGEASFALMSLVLHEVEDKASLLESLRDALGGGGRIAIIEFRPGALFGPPQRERIPEGKMLALLAKADFERPSVRGWRGMFYVATATKGPV